MKISSRTVAVVLAAAAPLLVSPRAFAQSNEPAPPPNYQVQQAQGPVYTAPLSQTTQTTYVPQSVALSGPEEISDYDDDRRPPAGYTPVRRTRKGLIIGGAITFGSAYGLSLLIAAAGQDSSRGSNPVAAMWVPAVGPFIQMGNTSSATANVFLLGDGLAQTAGLAMFIAGLAVPKTVLVRNDLAQGPTVQVAPLVGKGASGVSLSGTF